MRGISGITSLLRNYVETRNGRIRWADFREYFVDKIPIRSKLLLNWKKEPWPTRHDADGKAFATVKGRSALCMNDRLWLWIYPRLTTGGTPDRSKFHVPSDVCKSCQFHVKAKQYGRQRYALCSWEREYQKRDTPTAAELLSNSLKQAEEMLK